METGDTGAKMGMHSVGIGESMINIHQPQQLSDGDGSLALSMAEEIRALRQRVLLLRAETEVLRVDVEDLHNATLLLTTAIDKLRTEISDLRMDIHDLPSTYFWPRFKSRLRRWFRVA